jgi:prevent-host-death family protein
MTDTMIGQRDLRNDNAEIMRRVERGESFTITRNGKPVATLSPLCAEHHDPAPRCTAGQLLSVLQALPPMDAVQWERERAEDDAVFGPDDIGEGAG